MKRTGTLLYTLLLLLAALLWGTSYPMTKFIEEVPTFLILPVRFFFAALVLAVVFRKRFREAGSYSVRCGLALGLNLTMLFIYCTVGIKYTSSVNASFFTALDFLIVPVMNLLFRRVKLQRSIAIGAGICLIGMFLLTHGEEGGSFLLNLGDLLCVLASVHGSLEIVLLDKVSRDERFDTGVFTVVLMATICAVTAACGLFTGAFAAAAALTPVQFGAILYLGLFCSAGAFLLQSVGQTRVPSNRVGLIFSLEPASGCILSVLLLSEPMRLLSWIGAALIMASILYTELSAQRQAASELS